MSKAIRSIGRVFGGSSSHRSGQLMKGVHKSKLDKKPFEQKIAGQGHQEELRKRQASQTDRLEARAKGEAPSIAEAQLKQATNRSLKQQLAAAQSRKGGSSASRERQLAKQAANSRQQIAEQAAIAKIQEQQGADQALGQQLQATRAQDIGVETADRGSLQSFENMKVQQDLAMAGMQLSANKQASAESGNWLKRTIGISDKNAKTKIKKEGSKSNFAKAISDEENKKNVNKVEAPKWNEYNKEQEPKSEIQKAAGMAGFSDEDSKKNVKKIDDIAEKSMAESKENKADSVMGTGEIAVTVATMGGGSGAAQGAKEVAKEGAKEAAKEGAKEAAKEGAKEAAKEAVKKGAKEGVGTALRKRLAAKLESKASLAEGKKDFVGPVKKKGFGTKLREKAQEQVAEAKKDYTTKDGLKSKLGEAMEGIAKDSAFSDTGHQIDKQGESQTAKSRRKLKEMSDRESKENIDSHNPKSFLDKLQAYSYEYDNAHKGKEGGGEGRFLSVMAQDLEKAGPVGKSMVQDTESGKVVDYGKGFGAMLANQAHLNARINELESKKKKR